VVRAGFAGAYTLVVSRSVIAELRSKTAAKPYLAARIPAATAEEFTTFLARVAEVIPELLEPFPAIGRDRDDDYLIAHALAAEADYLVSGDADLVSLGQIETLRMVSPVEFLSILRDSGRVR